MRPLKVLATALALSLLAAPIVAQARPERPAAAAKGGKAHGKHTAAQREARMLAALKKAGIDDARARKVVTVVKKYHAERAPVRDEMKKQREAMRGNTDASERAKAKEGIEAQKKKLADIRERQEKEIRALVTPAEQAKVLAAVKKANKHKHGKDGKGGKGGKKHDAKNASQDAA